MQNSYFTLTAWPCNPNSALLTTGGGCGCIKRNYTHTHGLHTTCQFSYGDINISYKLIKPNKTPVIRLLRFIISVLPLGKRPSEIKCLF